MNVPPSPPALSFPHRHLLGIDGLSRSEIVGLLDLAEAAVVVSRQIEK
jgi:aspartate carbamoyltransferase catalytic subunit